MTMENLFKHDRLVNELLEKWEVYLVAKANGDQQTINRILPEIGGLRLALRNTAIHREQTQRIIVNTRRD